MEESEKNATNNSLITYLIKYLTLFSIDKNTPKETKEINIALCEEKVALEKVEEKFTVANDLLLKLENEITQKENEWSSKLAIFKNLIPTLNEQCNIDLAMQSDLADVERAIKSYDDFLPDYNDKDVSICTIPEIYQRIARYDETIEKVELSTWNRLQEMQDYLKLLEKEIEKIDKYLQEHGSNQENCGITNLQGKLSY